MGCSFWCETLKHLNLKQRGNYTNDNVGLILFLMARHLGIVCMNCCITWIHWKIIVNLYFGTIQNFFFNCLAVQLIWGGFTQSVHSLIFFFKYTLLKTFMCAVEANVVDFFSIIFSFSFSFLFGSKSTHSSCHSIIRELKSRRLIPWNLGMEVFLWWFLVRCK